MQNILKCATHRDKPLHYIAECRSKSGMHLMCEICSKSFQPCCKEKSVCQEHLETFHLILPMLNLIDSWIDAPQDPFVVLQNYIEKETGPMKKKLEFLNCSIKKVEINGKYWLLEDQTVNNGNAGGIGSGITGKVFWGGFMPGYKNLEDFPDRKCAIKCFGKDVYWNTFKRETDILKQILHPNVGLYLDAHWDQMTDNYYLIMQYCSGNTLETLVEAFKTTNPKSKKLCLPEAVVNWVAMQISQGLYALHIRNVAHGDLKPENIVIQGDVDAKTIKENYLNLIFKITDFANSFSNSTAPTKKAQEAQEKIDWTPCLNHLAEGRAIQLVCGTKAYCAPEQLCNCNTGNIVLDKQKLDIWSFGVLLYLCLVGVVPNEKRELNEEDRNLMSDFAFDYINCMVKHNATERMNSDQLIEHEFVKPNCFQVQLLYGELCLIRLLCQLGVMNIGIVENNFSVGKLLNQFFGFNKINQMGSVADKLKGIAQYFVNFAKDLPEICSLASIFTQGSAAEQDQEWINYLQHYEPFKKCIRCLISGNGLELFALLREMECDFTNVDVGVQNICQRYKNQIPPLIPSLIFGVVFDFQFTRIFMQIFRNGAAIAGCKNFVGRHNRDWDKVDDKELLNEQFFNHLLEHVQNCTEEAASKMIPSIGIHFNSAIPLPNCCSPDEYQPHSIHGHQLRKEIRNERAKIAFELTLFTTRKKDRMEYFWLRRIGLNEALPKRNSIACLGPIDFYTIAYLGKTLPHVDAMKAKHFLEALEKRLLENGNLMGHVLLQTLKKGMLMFPVEDQNEKQMDNFDQNETQMDNFDLD